ncbi:hypothetical protein V6N12_051110 [Hibiscus sabdariffa]|uniref:Uncharacterized protein n=1 Tax=Hibiscus sabdariffa TaxID=183260 RepID=A0ABR2GF95_9ROSI
MKDKETYASMAAKARPMSGNRDFENGMDSDEVVVLDEDCIVDESEIALRGTEQAPIDLIPPIEEASHGKQQNVSRSGAAMSQTSITKNVATKDVVGGFNVVPLEVGNATIVVPHTVHRGSGNHSDILIIEPGYEANVVEVKSPLSRAPTAWTKEFVDHIDMLVARENSHPNVHVRRDQLDSGMDYSSDDGGEFVATSLDPQNARVDGAASSTFRQIFISLVREYKPEVVVLFEPRVFVTTADWVLNRFGFAHSFRVESHGFSGGLWLLWKDSIVVDIHDVSNQFINGCFRSEGSMHWIQFTAIYASPHGPKQKKL